MDGLTNTHPYCGTQLFPSPCSPPTGSTERIVGEALNATEKKLHGSRDLSLLLFSLSFPNFFEPKPYPDDDADLFSPVSPFRAFVTYFHSLRYVINIFPSVEGLTLHTLL